MKYWTEEEKQRVRYGVVKLAEDEMIKRNLNQWQLQAIFHILAFGAPVDYKYYNSNAPEEENKSRVGWFIEDRFKE